MTTCDIQSHIQEFYDLDESASLISQIIDKILDLTKEWHNLPLENLNSIVFFDAAHF